MRRHFAGVLSRIKAIERGRSRTNKRDAAACDKCAAAFSIVGLDGDRFACAVTGKPLPAKCPECGAAPAPLKIIDADLTAI